MVHYKRLAVSRHWLFPLKIWMILLSARSFQECFGIAMQQSPTRLCAFALTSRVHCSASAHLCKWQLPRGRANDEVLVIEHVPSPLIVCCWIVGHQIRLASKCHWMIWIPSRSPLQIRLFRIQCTYTCVTMREVGELLRINLNAFCYYLHAVSMFKMCPKVNWEERGRLSSCVAFDWHFTWC